jgi:hypothetical protein
MVCNHRVPSNVNDKVITNLRVDRKLGEKELWLSVQYYPEFYLGGNLDNQEQSEPGYLYCRPRFESRISRI